jgi:hypothetical protein
MGGHDEKMRLEREENGPQGQGCQPQYWTQEPAVDKGVWPSTRQGQGREAAKVVWG